MAPSGPPPRPAFDRTLGLVAALALPPLAGVVLGLTLLLGPLPAAALGLLATWAVLGGALLARADRDWLAEWLTARWPGRLSALLLALPVLVLGAQTLRLLGQDPLPAHLILAAALAAALGATVEELFWRGALLPEPTPASAALSLALFALSQGVWLAALGLETGWPSWGVLAAALALGGVWTAVRLLTGTVGAALLSHAGVKLFAFVQVLALGA